MTALWNRRCHVKPLVWDLFSVIRHQPVKLLNSGRIFIDYLHH